MRQFPLALALAASTAVTTFAAYTPTLRADDRYDRRADRYDDRREERRDERRGERREEAGWVKLGERRVDFRAEKDVIEVGREEGKFTRLRFRVAEGDVEMFKMRVIFANGEPYEPNVRQSFHEGERSHDIDLPDRPRTIRRVEFFYHSEHHRDPAVIELIGKEAR